MSVLNMWSCSTSKPQSRTTCLVKSSINKIEAKDKPMKGPHRDKHEVSLPRLAGVFAATKVNKLEKDAKLNANISMCANLRLLMVSNCWNAGPKEAVSSAGQHQAPSNVGSESEAKQPEPKTDASTSFPTLALEASAPEVGSSSLQASCQPCRGRGV